MVLHRPIEFTALTGQVPTTIPRVQELATYSGPDWCNASARASKAIPIFTSRVTNKLREAQVTRKTAEIRIVLGRKR